MDRSKSREDRQKIVPLAKSLWQYFFHRTGILIDHGLHDPPQALDMEVHVAQVFRGTVLGHNSTGVKEFLDLVGLLLSTLPVLLFLRPLLGACEPVNGRMDDLGSEIGRASCRERV